jgi:CHAT domain-containing protein
VFYCLFSENSDAQNSNIDVLFNKFLFQYRNGDLINSDKTLNQILLLRDQLDNTQLCRIYINLGAISTLLGNYNNAYNYYNNAESLIDKESRSSKDAADIYINKAIIFGYQKSYFQALDYFEKGIRIYNNLDLKDQSAFSSLSSAFLNLGIINFETKDYQTALANLNKSVELKLKYHLSGLPFVYLNFAKTYEKIKNQLQANNYFLLSISTFQNDFGNEYYRLAEVYFEYGTFLNSIGKQNLSIKALDKALKICIKNYGNKHSLVSNAYKLIGDHFNQTNQYDSALYYYQKSLIAVSKDFNNTGIFTNPSIDSSLFDIRLLDNLKSKAQALELYGKQQKDPELKSKVINSGLETIDLALRLIDRIRNNYMSEESRIYLAENEKETYLFATHLAYTMYTLTGDKNAGFRMYGFARKAKAAILRNEISGNEILYSAGVPDSLRVRQNTLTGNIAAYSNLILEENRKTTPDSNKITLWKDALFDMNREKEKVNNEMETVFPEYHNLLRKTDPFSLELIQDKLGSNETIVDYMLSNQYAEGKRKMYIFLITKSSLEFSEQYLDSTFASRAELIRRTGDPSMGAGQSENSFKSYTQALNYMYLNLISPVENRLKNKKLIIIPDEEIGWLSFDSFLKDLPQNNQGDYEGLNFLVKDYIFSYGYSSSLIFSKTNFNIRQAKVVTFSPDYSNSIDGGKSLQSLQSAGAEISSVFKWFKGVKYNGTKATKANFLNELQAPAIFHLAMHSLTDSSNSKYSCLMFDSHTQTADSSKLFNYEISLARIKSPMVVLSACNSGTGTLYSGEGLMSLARSFILAGASSVIKTAWEINDETSSEIISRFYYYLSKGKFKDEAMHLAKLDYLKNASPAFANPYYWAAYEVLGDNEPVKGKFKTLPLIISLLLIITAGLAVVYFRRRRIDPARSA